MLGKRCYDMNDTERPETERKEQPQISQAELEDHLQRAEKGTLREYEAKPWEWDDQSYDLVIEELESRGLEQRRDVHEVLYRNEQTFVRHSEDDEDALEWVYDHAYDGEMVKEEATVNGPMTRQEANKRGNKHRMKIKEMRNDE